MARGKTTEDLSTLQMALVGYQVEKERIEEKIREIQARLKGKAVPSAGVRGAEAGRWQARPERGGAQAHLGGAEEALGRTPQECQGRQGSVNPHAGAGAAANRPRWCRAPGTPTHSAALSVPPSLPPQSIRCGRMPRGSTTLAQSACCV